MNFLSDTEWMHLVDTIGLVNALDEDHEFRRTVLERLRILIPYDSAAFFLTDRSLVQGNESSFLADPVGVDVRAGKLEEYMASAWETDEVREQYSLTKSGVIRESDVLRDKDREDAYFKDYLDEMFVLTCNFACEEGPLGSLNLNREATHGDFSDKEVHLLRLLEPHITMRLQKRQLESVPVAPSAQDFFERYHVTAREQDIIYCLQQGMRNDDISAALCISPGTTKKHLENIFKKCGVSSRLELMMLMQG